MTTRLVHALPRPQAVMAYAASRAALHAVRLRRLDDVAPARRVHRAPARSPTRACAAPGGGIPATARRAGNRWRRWTPGSPRMIEVMGFAQWRQSGRHRTTSASTRRAGEGMTTALLERAEGRGAGSPPGRGARRAGREERKGRAVSRGPGLRAHPLPLADDDRPGGATAPRQLAQA